MPCSNFPFYALFTFIYCEKNLLNLKLCKVAQFHISWHAHKKRLSSMKFSPTLKSSFLKKILWQVFSFVVNYVGCQEQRRKFVYHETTDNGIEK